MVGEDGGEGCQVGGKTMVGLGFVLGSHHVGRFGIDRRIGSSRCGHRNGGFCVAPVVLQRPVKKRTLTTTMLFDQLVDRLGETVRKLEGLWKKFREKVAKGVGGSKEKKRERTERKFLHWGWAVAFLFSWFPLLNGHFSSTRVG